MKQLSWALLLSVFPVMMLSMSTTRPLMRISLLKLKQTVEVMKEYPHYQPYNGLVMVEKGILKNLYEFSGFYERTLAKKALDGKQKDAWDKEIEDYFNRDLTTGTQNLVRQLFHMPPGGTFNLSTAPNNPVKILGPRDIGQILRAIHEAQIHPKKSKELVKKVLEKILGVMVITKEWNPFLNGIEKSLEEQSGSNPLFAQNTTQNILLGYMLCKCESERDLAAYCSGFLGKDVGWVQNDYTREELLRYVSDTEIDLNDEVAFGNLVCGQVYQQLYASALPKIITQNIGVSFEGIFFTDCVECLMRNLCNIATYNGQHCGVAPAGLHINRALVDYYKSYADNTTIVQKDAHEAWIPLVENKDNFVYILLFDPTTKKGVSIVSHFSAYDGFIPVVDVDRSLPIKKVSIGGKEYSLYEQRVDDFIFLLVPQSTGLHCCELMPLLRNIIILMNDFFGMNLYESRDLYASDFDKTYFSTMCEKVHFDIVSHHNKNKSESVVLSKTKQTFALKLDYKAHGSVSSMDNPDNMSRQIPSSIGEAKVALLIGLGFTPTVLDSLLYIYYRNLSDPNQRVFYIYSMLKTFEPKFQKIISNLFVSFAFVEDNYFIKNLLEYCTSFTKTMRIFVMLHLKIYHDFSPFYLKKDLVSINDISVMLSMINGYNKNFDRLVTEAVSDAIITKNNKALALEIVHKGLYKYFAEICFTYGILNKAELLDSFNKNLDNKNISLTTKQTFIQILLIKKILEKEDKLFLLDLLDKEADYFSVIELLIKLQIIDKTDKERLLNLFERHFEEPFWIIFFRQLYDAGIIGKEDKEDLLYIVEKYIEKLNAQILFRKLLELNILDRNDKEMVLQLLMHNRNAYHYRLYVQYLRDFGFINHLEYARLFYGNIFGESKEKVTENTKVLEKLNKAQEGIEIQDMMDQLPKVQAKLPEAKIVDVATSGSWWNQMKQRVAKSLPRLRR